jgi:uncharacterized repeat protein (TIGR03803 family)
LALALATAAPAQTYRVLKSFTGSDGAGPQAGLVLAGSALYGTTEFGGSSSNGVVFKVNTDGSGYAVLQSFTGSDAANPVAGLVLAGSTLYGTARHGGNDAGLYSDGCGVVFEVNTNGSGYAVLRSFSGSDGAWPEAGLLLAGSTLYGTTSNGGSSGQGVVFGMNTDGSEYAVLESFAYIQPNGEELPYAGLVLAGGTLYGTTVYGGSSGGGVVFKVNTDGTGYTVLTNLNGTDGAYPYAGLVLAGGTLYGATSNYGATTNGVLSGRGNIFKVNTDGSGFSVLKSFTGSEGANPQASLILAGSALYGTTAAGGSSDDGVIFKVNTDGSGYAVLKSFTGTDGARPLAALLLADGTLYGTTAEGGDLGCGVIFSLGAPAPPTITAAPQNQAAEAGEYVTFSVQVANLEPLAYQWVFNGTNALEGATNSVLQLADIQLAQAGAYAVVVTNNHGAVTSSPAILKVFPLGTVPVPCCTQGALQAALAGGGTVRFACDGTITLSHTIEIGTNTVLDASGNQITISGSNACRVFFVDSNVNFTLINLTIANGLSTNGSGGGIYNDGTLNAANCLFLSNSAVAGLGLEGSGGAIHNQGTLSATDCAFLQNFVVGGDQTQIGNPGGAARGGAICNLGSMMVERSLFASNMIVGGTGGPGAGGVNSIGSWPPPSPGSMGATGGDACGGALFIGGPAILVNCTLAGNQARGGPGGQGGAGGTGFNTGTLQNFTLAGGPGGSGGTGYGAACDPAGALRLTNCTIALNTSVGGPGGVGGMGNPNGSPGGDGMAAGVLQTTNGISVNSLLAGNSPANCAGTIADAGHNLSSDASCAFTNLGSLNNTDPKLGPLADNGGPTLTMALLPGSPAIGAGDSASAPPTDQRGYPRPIRAGVDIGAYQAGRPGILTPPQSQTVCLYSTVQFSVSATGSPPLSYQWFFEATNALVGGPSPTLQLTNVQPSQAGAYTVVITNAFGAVTSPPASLNLSLTPPTLITSPTSQVAWTGTSISFQAVAAGCLPLAYQWFFNETNPLPAATEPVLCLTNLQPAQAGGYSVLVTNTMGAVTSAVAVLAVTPPTATNSTETALRAALAVGGTIGFSSSGMITLANTVEIARDTVLDGTGQEVTISGNSSCRVFFVDTNVHFTLINLTIAYGQCDYGAGIYNDGGQLVLERCRFSSNAAYGAGGVGSGVAESAGGGAIYNLGTLAAKLCTFSYNSANGGPGAPGTPWPVANNGPGGPGNGGALFNAGVAAVTGSAFDMNRAAGGGGGSGGGGGFVHAVKDYPADGAAAADGGGGAIYNSGNLTLVDSTCTTNAAAGGPGGGGGWADMGAFGYYDGPGANGGPGGSGSGGALYNAGLAMIVGSTLAGNTGIGGLGGGGGLGFAGGNGDQGGSGNGGAVYSSGTAGLVNSTLTGNTSAGGAGGAGSNGGNGDGGNGGAGGSGVGGAISGPCFLTNCTLVSNSAIGGLGGGGGGATSPPYTNGLTGAAGSAAGGAIYGATLANTLVAADSPAGGAASGAIGHNLYVGATAGVVGPLADNGGPTLTMALLPGSPAIDAADTAAAPPTDQRGFPRPFGAAADIGAFEYGAWPLLSISRFQAGGFTISVHGASGQSCHLLTSTTLTNWVAVATNAAGPDGSLTFQIDAGSDHQRFWRVVSP